MSTINLILPLMIQAFVFASIILIFGALTSVRNARKEFVRQIFGDNEEYRVIKLENKNRLNALEKIIMTARKAGLKNSNQEIILMVLGVVMITYIVSYLLFGNPVIASIITPAGLFIFYNYLAGRIKKRADKMSDEMEDWLLVLASHLKSGVSLAQALRLSLDRLDGSSLKNEVEDIVKTIDFGNTAKDALEMFEDRIPAVEYKMVTVAVSVNSALGGNLAESFKNIASNIAERRRIRDEAKSLSSQGKLASNAIALVILGLICALRFMNPEYLDPFFNSTLGMVIFTFAIGWAVLGWWLVRKISMPSL